MSLHCQNLPLLPTLTLHIEALDIRQRQHLALKVLCLLSPVVLSRSAKLDISVAEAVVSVEGLDGGKSVRQEALGVAL